MVEKSLKNSNIRVRVRVFTYAVSKVAAESFLLPQQSCEIPVQLASTFAGLQVHAHRLPSQRNRAS